MPEIDNKLIPMMQDFGIDATDNQQIYDWIRDNNHPDTDQHFGMGLPWLMLDFPEWPHKEMLAEAKALDEQGLIPDYNSGNNIGWSAVALYGLSSDSTLPYIGQKLLTNVLLQQNSLKNNLVTKDTIELDL